MIKSRIASLGLVGLAYGGIMVMGAADAPRHPVSAEAKAAAKAADKAAKALGKHQAAAAVAAAEQAVALAPRDADYRMLLGQGYLQAGRFQSAGQAFADTLALDAGNGKAALNLALAQVATGDWQAARHTLDTHADTIPSADRGLALALAGDTAGAVALLTDVARSPEASPKVRQNLALSYALAGQWQAARVVAATDLSPADVDARLTQWAAFVQPQAASDQIAALLGVHPAADGGQPVALALSAPVAVAPVVEAAAVTPAPVAPAVAAPAPVPAPVEMAAVTRSVSAIVFGPRQEVVQPLPAGIIERASGPIKVAARPGFTGYRGAAVKVAAKAPAFKPASGQWYVQIGAFDSAGVARDAWGRAKKRYAAFSGHQPNGVTFKAGTATFYRLSVGGFDRAGADRACHAYRARRGVCFVRTGAGDQVAAWVKPGNVQLALK